MAEHLTAAAEAAAKQDPGGEHEAAEWKLLLHRYPQEQSLPRMNRIGDYLEERTGGEAATGRRPPRDHDGRRNGGYRKKIHDLDHDLVYRSYGSALDPSLAVGSEIGNHHGGHQRAG